MPEKLDVYIGTYTGQGSQGIYLSQLDLGTGELSVPGLVAEVPQPSFLALHPTRPLLYAVSEVGDFDGKPTGSVLAYAIEAEGRLKLLGEQPSGGAAPCHVTVDGSGKTVLVANYSGGSVASFPIQEDGNLGAAGSVIQHQGKSVNDERQEGPHAHSINVDPTGRFAVAADLGLDKVLVYKLDAQRSSLAPHEPPSVAVTAGAGPRHFAFHPNGKFGYVINELDSTITALRYDGAQGTLEELQTIATRPSDYLRGGGTAEVQVHPSGKFLYGSNRGHDSIAIFAIDEQTGKLTAKGHQPTGGRVPRNFGIDPTGRYLVVANQDSDNVVVFRILTETGELDPTGKQVSLSRPVCIKFRQPDAR